MKNLAPVLDTLELLDQHILNHSVKTEKVSHWSVGMQIAHCLSATQQICEIIIASTPYTKKVKKNLFRRITMFTGWIPRGRARAPKVSIPVDMLTPSELKVQVATVKKNGKSGRSCVPQ